MATQKSEDFGTKKFRPKSKNVVGIKEYELS